MSNDLLSPTPLAGLELLLVDITKPDLPVRAQIGCPGVLLAGRIPTAHLVLPADDSEAAKLHHFLIELDHSSCRLTNQHKHGTLVNSLLLRTQCDLRHGDLIRAGKSVFLVEVRRQGEPFDLPASKTVIWPLLGDTTSPTDPAIASDQLPIQPAPFPQIPGYQCKERLGIGGVGSVFLVENHVGEKVACKVIRPELALDADTRARFRRETSHLRDLQHKHIVGFRDAGEANGLLYLVMDYVHGSNLADLIAKQGQFAVGRAVRLTCQILDALAEAHNNGVVHRDVKPSNVLVDNLPSGEEVRLADFGMAKAYQSDDASVTRVGVMGGTPSFAAPEMISDFRRAGTLADQYGAAATLYALLTASPPHVAPGIMELLDRIRNFDAVPVDKRRAGLPPDLASVIHRALSREPRLRYPKVNALRDALLPFAD